MGHLRACIAAMAVAMLLLVHAAAQGPDYSVDGPCTSRLTIVTMTLPKELGCKCQCGVKLFVHVPGGEGCTYKAPFPLVTFISGFQATSANYRDYARRLASWGLAVLQYDFTTLSPLIDPACHSDAAEAGFMLPFLAALREAAARPRSPLAGKLDLANMAAAGHSRGGKIAALHLAGMTPGVRTAYLIDPIDGSSFTEHKPGYPSAVELLRGRGKTFGMTAAGRIGLCNGAPFATGNWSHFDEVAANGSWLELVPNAGHLQFGHISRAWDLLCCTGCKGLVSQQEGTQLALVPMVTWLQQELRGAGGSSSGSKGGRRAARARGGPRPATPAAFDDWVCGEEAAGKIQFVVKGRGEVCPGGKRSAEAHPQLRVEVVQAQQQAADAAARAAAWASARTAASAWAQ